ncbi:MAG: hypothetical protein ABW321_24730 [Polyangiales bacterium]
MTRQLLSILLALAAVGCVKDADDPDDGTPTDNPSTGALLPWKIGNTWTYKVTDEDGVSDKTTTIEAEEAVGGTGPNKDLTAFRVVTLKADKTDQTISWQGPIASGATIVRYREQSFDRADGNVELEEHWDPYKIHIDGSADHTKAGASWLEDYEETKAPAVGSPIVAAERDRWTVDQPDVTVEVPAGKFEHAIVFTKAGAGDQKMYWYVRGVGKVKETGGQTEELESYTVAE